MRRRRYAVIDVNNLPDFLVFAATYANGRREDCLRHARDHAGILYLQVPDQAIDSWLVRVLKYWRKPALTSLITYNNQRADSRLLSSGDCPPRNDCCHELGRTNVIQLLPRVPLPLPTQRAAGKIRDDVHGT